MARARIHDYGPRREGQPVKRNPCWDHSLSTAQTPTPAGNGETIYVICSCTRRRAIPREEWEAELHRRDRVPVEGAL